MDTCGHPSRFEWTVGLTDVGKAAAGDVTEVQRLSDEEREDASETADDGDDTVEHRYVLRPGFEVRINLPLDLSSVEAGRLAEFLRTLPFSG
jgi:hypothetical protein